MVGLSVRDAYSVYAGESLQRYKVEEQDQISGQMRQERDLEEIPKIRRDGSMHDPLQYS